MADETTENQETPDEQAPEAVVETPAAEPVAETAEPVADDAAVAEEPAEVAVAEPVGSHHLGLRIARSIVGLLKAQSADLGFGQKRAVSVEMDDVVWLACRQSFAEHFLHVGQRGGPTEIDAHVAAERIECGA